MFEENLNELNEIVAKLESGNLGVEESLKLFKRGAELSKKCMQIIQSGKETIKEIKKDINGNITEEPVDFE